MALTDGVVWGMFRAVAATASLEQCSSGGLDDDGGGVGGGRGTCLTLVWGIRKTNFKFSSFSLSLIPFFVVCLSVGPSCHRGHQRRRVHISRLPRAPTCTHETKSKADRFFLPLPKGLQAARSPSDYLQWLPLHRRRSLSLLPCVFGPPPLLSLFSSILPPSMLHSHCSLPKNFFA